MKSPMAPPRMTRMRAATIGRRQREERDAVLIAGLRREAAQRSLAFPLFRAIPRNTAHAIRILRLLTGTAGEEQKRRQRQTQRNNTPKHRERSETVIDLRGHLRRPRN